MRDGDRDSLPVVGAADALAAVACYAGLPLVGALVGGLALAGLLGLAGGIPLIAAAVAAARVVLRGRRRPRAGRQASG